MISAAAVVNGCIKPLYRATTDDELIENSCNIHMVGVLLICGLLAINPAPYGRYNNRWKISLPAVKLPWTLVLLPSVVIPVWMVITDPQAWNMAATNWIILIFFVSHYFHRSLVHAFTMKNPKPSPILTLAMTGSFAAVNGFLQTYTLLHVSIFPANWLYMPQFLLGTFLFLAGSYINIYHDHVLLNLRKPGETGYKIPRGGLFQLVSCANYFGEVVEWWGYFFMANNYPAFVFAIFSTLFLVPRGVQYHKYYQKKFDSYPKSRKAVIPFIL